MRSVYRIWAASQSAKEAKIITLGQDSKPGKYEREDGKQDDVERQDVHESRLELQGQRLHHGEARLVEKVSGAELLGVEGVVESAGRVRH